MAREESDREDLLREATALIERVELCIAGEPEPIIAGFKRDGSLSIYFGGDPVYHLRPDGTLHRAFVNDKLYRMDSEQLVQLTRRRTETESLLLHHDLLPPETAAFRQAMQQRIQQLSSALSNGGFQIVGQVPPDCDVVGRLRELLQSRLTS